MPPKIIDADIVEEYETRAIRKGTGRSWRIVEQNIKPEKPEQYIIEGEELYEN